jgi:hypothetical protein
MRIGSTVDFAEKSKKLIRIQGDPDYLAYKNSLPPLVYAT